MSKTNRINDLSVAVVSLISLISFVAYFMFPHVVLAKEINKSKKLEFDIKKAILAPVISKSPADALGGINSENNINYKISAVVAKSEDVDKKASGGANDKKNTAEKKPKDPMAYVGVEGNFKVVGKRQLYVTGYSSTPDQTDDTPFITASNKHVRDGIVAANFLPFGTKIRIPAYYSDKIFVVEDRMNIKHNQKVDIWFLSRQEALNFGIRWTEIEILAEQ